MFPQIWQSPRVHFLTPDMKQYASLVAALTLVLAAGCELNGVEDDNTDSSDTTKVEVNTSTPDPVESSLDDVVIEIDNDSKTTTTTLDKKMNSVDMEDEMDSDTETTTTSGVTTNTNLKTTTTSTTSGQ